MSSNQLRKRNRDKKLSTISLLFKKISDNSIGEIITEGLQKTEKISIDGCT